MLQHNESADENAIREFSQPLLASCLIILITVFITGLLANGSGIIISAKQFRHSSKVRMSYVVIFISNLVVVLICLPMVIAALLHPELIDEDFCYVQENLTFFIVTFSIALPSLWALETYDKIFHHSRNFCTTLRFITGVISMIIGLACIVVVPLFVVKSGTGLIHEHGCHWWASRADLYFWTQIGLLGTILLLSTTIQISLYYVIFSKTRNQHLKLKGQILRNRRVNPVSLAVPDSAVSKQGNSQVGCAKTCKDLPEPSETEQASSSIDGQSTSTRTRSTSASLSVCENRMVRTAHRSVAIVSVAVVVSQVICWLPLLLLNIALTQIHLGLSSELRIFCMVIGYIPAAVEPIAISLISRQHKNALRRWLTICKQKCSRWCCCLRDFSQSHRVDVTV